MSDGYAAITKIGGLLNGHTRRKELLRGQVGGGWSQPAYP